MASVEFIPVNPSPERFVDKHVVAEYLSVTVSWVEKKTMDRSFPSHRIGGHRRYRLSEVGAWAETDQQEARA